MTTTHLIEIADSRCTETCGRLFVHKSGENMTQTCPECGGSIEPVFESERAALLRDLNSDPERMILEDELRSNGIPVDEPVKPKKVGDTDATVEGSHPCRRCARTGSFITYVENGVPKGPGGICFRCAGKGFHTQADRKRNLGHDRHAFARGY